MPNQWLTPDVDPGSTVTIEVECPDSLEFIAILKGCLLLLTEPSNFESYGSLLPDEVALLFLESIQGALDT